MHENTLSISILNLVKMTLCIHCSCNDSINYPSLVYHVRQEYNSGLRAHIAGGPLDTGCGVGAEGVPSPAKGPRGWPRRKF